MPNIGLTELLVVLAIALLVIGPKRLPDIGRQVGRAIREFRRAGTTVTKELGLDEVADDVRELKQSAQKAKDSVNVRKQLGLDDLGPLDLDAEAGAAAPLTAKEKTVAAAATAAEAADHSGPAPPTQATARGGEAAIGADPAASQAGGDGTAGTDPATPEVGVDTAPGADPAAPEAAEDHATATAASQAGEDHATDIGANADATPAESACRDAPADGRAGSA